MSIAIVYQATRKKYASKIECTRDSQVEPWVFHNVSRGHGVEDFICVPIFFPPTALADI